MGSVYKRRFYCAEMIIIDISSLSDKRRPGHNWNIPYIQANTKYD